LKFSQLTPTTQGILYIVTGVFIFTLQDVAIKSISDTYPILEIVFIRSLIALPIVLGIVHIEGGLHQLRSKQLGLQLVRATLAFLTYIFYFLALSALPIADAVAIFFIAPLFVTILSAWLLKEVVDGYRWLAVLIGFMGVLLMVRPGNAAFDSASLFAVVAALAYAVVAILTRRLGKSDSSSSMAFYATLTYIFASALIAPLVRQEQFMESNHAALQFLVRPWAVPTPGDLAIIGFTALAFATGFFFLTKAYHVAEATAVTPFEYTAVPLSLLWGFLFWGDLPDKIGLLGMMLIISSGLLIVWQEIRHRKKY